jgi:hypothetical protein
MKKLTTATLVAAGLVAALTACGGGDGGSANDAFCEKARVADSFSTQLDDMAADASPEEFEQALDGYIAAIEDAQEQAPSEIEDAIATSLSGLREVRDIASNNEFNVTETFNDEALVALFDDGDLEQSGDDIDAFLETECGITPSTDDTSATADTAATGDTTAGDDSIADQLADDFAAGAGIELTPEQRTCVGQGLIDQIGLGTLAEQADKAEIDSGVLAEIFAVLDGCGVAVPTS